MAAKGRKFTPLELAIAFALVGSLLAVALPTFFRDLHASHLVEPVDGLQRIGVSALAYHETHRAAAVGALPAGVAPPAAPGALPVSAPLTPADVPRGVLREDPAGTWDHPTWQALAFRPTREGVPHAFSFSFENQGTGFVALAHGDLDGDGVLSTFELRGTVGDVSRLEPGLYIDAEFE
jgi:hypothetical protein